MKSREEDDNIDIDDIIALLNGKASRNSAEALDDVLPRCPLCSRPTKAIVYGFPTRGPLPEENWVPGGCVIMNGNPNFRCSKCGFSF